MQFPYYFGSRMADPKNAGRWRVDTRRGDVCSAHYYPNQDLQDGLATPIKNTAKLTTKKNRNLWHAQASIPNRSQLTRAQGFPSSQDGTPTSPTIKTEPLSSDEGRATQLHIYAPAH